MRSFAILRPERRELFNRLAEHLNILAAEVEKSIACDPDDDELKSG